MSEAVAGAIGYEKQIHYLVLLLKYFKPYRSSRILSLGLDNVYYIHSKKKKLKL